MAGACPCWGHCFGECHKPALPWPSGCDGGAAAWGAHRLRESSTAYQAHLQIKTGTAQRYSQEAYERHDTLEAAKGTDALVDAYTEQPYMICMDDITEDAEDWRNQNLLAYFELKSVALKKQ